MSAKMTNANLAHQLVGVAKLVSQERDYLASGMGNPAFCSADATARAEDLCDELCRRLIHIKKLCRAARQPATLDSPRTE
jgi:hypothetical protein